MARIKNPGGTLKTENEECAGKALQIRGSEVYPPLAAPKATRVLPVPARRNADGEFPGSPPPASPMA
jgi:hypothetical protein